jgi:2-polyprenyl-3-methyl-5-hydroxy-6-metoxy-1,4-benzoquinol methylase
MGFKRFAALCAAEARAASRHGGEYLQQHLGRFYETFSVCSKLTLPETRLLSVGAGGAYVEKQLKRFCGADVTVVDFPEAVEVFREDYEAHGFQTMGTNLAEGQRLGRAESFDVVLSLEVVEHLPIAPYEHIRCLCEALRPGGYLVLSTPNAARLTNISRLLRRKPILPEADLTFAPPTFGNEYIHRREYVASEIVTAMKRAGLAHERTYYLSGRQRNWLSLRQHMRRLYVLIPHLRKNMLLVGRKPDQDGSTQRGETLESAVSAPVTH